MTAPGVAYAQAEYSPPTQQVPSAETSPVSRINSRELRQLGANLNMLFMQYKSDRRLAEFRWLRNQRQYLGIYDPEIEKELSVNRSKAFPRLTRVKCISVLSRLMNLMFQGNERNWELHAAPWPDITPEEVAQAIEEAEQEDKDGGAQVEVDLIYAMAAVQRYADRRAETLSKLIDDQLQELGGDQSEDYVALNRRVLQSGIIYGLGVMRGPFAREATSVVWNIDDPKRPIPKRKKVYKPLFEFLPVWDFYPDMSAKRFNQMDGYFIRHVFSRGQLVKLMRRSDFIEGTLRDYLANHQIGNYRPEWYESELRAMGVKANVNEQKMETTKYEVLAWHGPTSGHFLQLAGCEVPQEKLADDIDAEVWMLDGNIIKCTLNPWRDLGVDMNMIHTFLFDEDDTSPVGFGLPNAIRDSQMSVSAAARMLMDNASVVCGPNIELNTDLLRPDQDLQTIAAYKVWYREGTGADAQFAAVRNLQIDAHMDDLIKIIDLFMKFADMETFVGPATGGDMAQAPSEPLRTASGASMLRGEAALPFKDMIRSFDGLTQGIIQSMVVFNRQFNPEQAPDGDYDVIARGASSLMAKELRGMQADQLVATLTPEEKQEIDARKLLLARLKARDMEDIMVDTVESKRRDAQQSQIAQQQQDQQNQMVEAQVRKLLSDAFKNIAAAQKNTAQADAQTVDAALDLLIRGMENGAIQSGSALAAPGGGVGPAAQPSLPGGGPGGNGVGGLGAFAPGNAQAGLGGAGQPPNLPGAPG